MTYQQMIDNLGNSFFDTNTIMNMESNFPSDPNTNPIGTYGVGMNSDARHQAASARASDKFKDALNFMPWIRSALRGPIADTVSLAGGAGNELVGSLFDWAKSGFQDPHYLTAAKEDMVSNFKGTFGTKYGVPTNEIMEKVYAENGYLLNKTPNIFNQGTLDAQQQVPMQPAAPEQLPQMRDDPRRADLVAQQQKNQPTIIPDPVKQTVINTPSNQTKFGANRSTAIKGGRGGRGNYSKPAATSPSVSRPRARATRGRSAPIVRQSRNGPPQNRFR